MGLPVFPVVIDLLEHGVNYEILKCIAGVENVRVFVGCQRVTDETNTMNQTVF